MKLELILFNGYGEHTTKYGELAECLNGYVLLSGMELRVSLDSVITLKASNLKYSFFPQRIGGEVDRIPMTMSNLSNRETGYIRGKLSVKVNVDNDAYNFYMKFGRFPKSVDNLYRNINELGQRTDLEIRCKNGAVVKCHSALLTGNAWQKVGKRLEGEWDKANDFGHGDE